MGQWDIIKIVCIAGFCLTVLLLLLRIIGDVSENTEKISSVHVDTIKTITNHTLIVERDLTEVKDSLTKLNIDSIDRIHTNNQEIHENRFRISRLEKGKGVFRGP